MKAEKDNSNHGFIREGVSAHCSRTMMLDELGALLAAVPEDPPDYRRFRFCVEEENCLAKRSGITRKITFTHLARLYSLDYHRPLFRALLDLWRKDAASLPLLALLCACARDPLLRSAAPFILDHKNGEEISSQAMADFLEKKYRDRYSKATLRSASRNLRSTFTQSGHLEGKSRKIRVHVKATPASVSYALYLGKLEGLSGMRLFQTGYMSLLDCSFDEALRLAQTAAQKGWLIMNHIGDIIDIEFPKWRNV